MAIRYSLGTSMLLLVVMSTAVEAQSRNSRTSHWGGVLGKPFQQIQSRLDALDQRIVALESRVQSLETSLRAELASINASVTGLQGWAGSLDGAIDLMVAHAQANQSAIAALEGSIASLAAALAAVEADIAGVAGQLDTVTALEAQAAALRATIDQHTAQMAVFQGQIASAQAFLTTMAGGTCAAGQAIADIAASGAITCITPTAGGVQVLAVQRGFAFSEGLHTFTVTCPLGMVSVGGGYDGAAGLAVVGSFPTETAWVMRVDFRPPTPLTFASVTAVAKCVPR